MTVLIVAIIAFYHYYYTVYDVAVPHCCNSHLNRTVILQVVLEIHDMAGRLRQIVAMLKAKKYLVSCKPGLGPETHMVYARRNS